MSEEDAIVGTGIASVQSVDEILEGKGNKDGRPSALVTIDEYGSFLTRISTKAKLATLLKFRRSYKHCGAGRPKNNTSAISRSVRAVGRTG